MAKKFKNPSRIVKIAIFEGITGKTFQTFFFRILGLWIHWIFEQHNDKNILLTLCIIYGDNRTLLMEVFIYHEKGWWYGVHNNQSVLIYALHTLEKRARPCSISGVCAKMIIYYIKTIYTQLSKSNLTTYITFPWCIENIFKYIIKSTGNYSRE